MKQILILSGKGGTGKTTLASAFIKLAQAKAYADCDVDAPNLHLVGLEKSNPESSEYYGLDKARINKNLCIECDACRQACRFDAIFVKDSYEVMPYSCEGCGVCQLVCPVDAIEMEKTQAGDLFLYKSQARTFSTAQLKMGEGTSGLLVTQVKKQLFNNINDDVEISIIDGSPGIGCPAIASISGVDFVLIVAEPSISGLSDMKRIVETAKRFGVEILVCVNKYDSNPEKTEDIKNYCKDNKLKYIGHLPFDPMAVKAINQAKTIVDFDCISGRAAREIYNNLMEEVYNKEEKTC